MKKTEWTMNFGGGIGNYPTCIPPTEDSQLRQIKMQITGLGLQSMSLSDQMDVLYAKLHKIEGFETLKLRSQINLIKLIGESVSVGAGR